MKYLVIAAAALGIVSFAVPQAQAVGCVSGAAVGGVAGHMAGHHGVLGAAAGCAVGHHEANVQARQARQNAAPPAASDPSRSTNN